MRDETQKTLISVISAGVAEWRRREGWSRETVADEIVKKHVDINGPSITGIVFDPHSRDVFSCMRANMERVYRWLDDVTKDSTLLPANFIPSILAALPVDLRLQCVSQILRPLGFEVCTAKDEAALAFNAAAHASKLAKEGAEAVVQILSLTANPSPEQIEQVCKELDDVSESVGVAKRSVRSVLH